MSGKKIVLEKDEREENLVKDQEEKVIGFKQSEYTCKVYNKDGTFWVPNNNEVATILNLISKNEDYKYPNGLGRNMFFLAYIYPLFQNFLHKNGFKPLTTEVNFSQMLARETDLNYNKFLQDTQNEDFN